MNLYEVDIEEEEYVRPPLPKFQFTFSADEPIKCKTLCIAFYGISSLYASTLVNTDKPLALLNFQKAKQKSLASVYYDEEQARAFLIFNDVFEEMKEILLAEFIHSKFVFEEMIVLSARAEKTLEESQGSNCRYISSSKWKECHGSRYPQGLEGPEADLIIWCETNKVPMICFIGLYSEYELNREIINKIFGILNGKYGFSSTQDITAQIKKYNMRKYSNRLYL